MGGTALRSLHALPRYSEGLDSVLDAERREYAFDKVLAVVVRGLEREGYAVEIKHRESITAVDRAFARFPSLSSEVGLSPHGSEVLSVKMQVDTDPPEGAVLAASEVRRFVLIRIHHNDRASMLAGKLAAVLMRSYTKGRDLYGLMWYSPIRCGRRLSFLCRRALPARVDGTIPTSLPMPCGVRLYCDAWTM